MHTEQLRTSDHQYDVLKDEKKHLDEILQVVKYDECYNDMLQYLSYTGIFNLANGTFKEWGEI